MCLHFGNRGTTTNATTSKEEHKHDFIDVINQVVNQNTVCSAAVLYKSFEMLDSFIVWLAITILICLYVSLSYLNSFSKAQKNKSYGFSLMLFTVEEKPGFLIFLGFHIFFWANMNLRNRSLSFIFFNFPFKTSIFNVFKMRYATRYEP